MIPKLNNNNKNAYMTNFYSHGEKDFIGCFRCNQFIIKCSYFCYKSHLIILNTSVYRDILLQTDTHRSDELISDLSKFLMIDFAMCTINFYSTVGCIPNKYLRPSLPVVSLGKKSIMLYSYFFIKSKILYFGRWPTDRHAHLNVLILTYKQTLILP